MSLDRSIGIDLLGTPALRRMLGRGGDSCQAVHLVKRGRLPCLGYNLTVFLFLLYPATLCTYCLCFSSCVFFIFLVSYRCDGHAIIFTFNLNSFHVHVLTYIVLPSSFFLSTAVNFIFMYADLGKNKID